MSELKNSTQRTRIFRANLEQLKKEEWDRRRKLRLQQVRQQARGIASVIRKQRKLAVDKEEELAQSAKAEAGAKLAERRRNEMEDQLAECLISVGTGHASAEALSEIDQLMKHKAELQESLARLRAELAAEKTNKSNHQVEFVDKDQIKVTVSKVKNPIAKNPPITNKPPCEEICRDKAISIPHTPPSLVSSTSINNEGSSLLSKKTIPYRIFSARNRKAAPRSKIFDVIDGRKSCPLATEDESEVDSELNDSDDSDRTWPPASVKKKKNRPCRVRMYDHSVKKCSEYVQKCGVVRMEDPCSLDMKTLIEEEEELLLKKTEENVENERLNLQRGLKALKEEKSKQDFDRAIKDCFSSAREKRLKKAYEHSSSREALPGAFTKNDKKSTEAEEQCDNAVTLPEIFTDRISSVVARLTKKRLEVLDAESKRDSLIESVEKESSDEESYNPPLWIQEELAIQKELREKVNEPKPMLTPETVMSKIIEAERSEKNSSCAESVSSSSATSEAGKAQADVTSAASPASHSKDLSSNADTDNNEKTKSTSTSSSVEGVDIEIQITADKTAQSQVNQRSNTPTPPPLKTSDSSTSYYSPPDPLNPQQMSVLSDILSKVSTKNNNPMLHHYISRVLHMSRHSLSNLEDSSCSEFSIDTNIFSKSRPSTSSNVEESIESTRAKNVHFDCIDNMSTAATTSSFPISPGDVGNGSHDHTKQIAQLLKNICKLQDIYFTHSSASETLSESRSSYQSITSKVNPLRVLPQVPDANSRCEDTTGLFGNHCPSNGTSFDQYSPVYDMEQKNVINFPSQLNPKPFPDQLQLAEILTSLPSRRNEGEDRADILERKALYEIHRKNEGKIIESLSDIESVVSSIQNTPHKKIGSHSGFVPLSQQPPFSTLSDISSTDFINSAELSNNNLIESSSNKSDVEEVFRSLGIGWALTTLRRTRKSQYPAVESSSKSDMSSQKALSSSLTSSSGYRHSTPLKVPPTRDPKVDNVSFLTPPDVNLHCPSLVK